MILALACMVAFEAAVLVIVLARLHMLERSRVDADAFAVVTHNQLLDVAKLLASNISTQEQFARKRVAAVKKATEVTP